MYMLIGVPGAGKSTWLKNNAKEGVILSTDNYIETVALSENSTYDAVFQRTIKEATADLNKKLKEAVEAEVDIYWDQTNLTEKSRANKLRQIPNGYRRVAVFFKTPESEEWKKRLNRPGKTIPQYILKNMADTLVEPTLIEGFDAVVNIQ